MRNLEGKRSSRESPRAPQRVPLGNLGITGVTEVQEITDARFGKRKGTPFGTVVLLLWHEVKGYAGVVLTRGALMWNSNW